MSDYTLREVQKKVDNWVQEVGNGYWSPHEILARMIEEVGETARLINHLHGSKKKKSTEPTQDLADELADIIFALVCLANSQNIDLQEAFEAMMDKYNKRDKTRYK